MSPITLKRKSTLDGSVSPPALTKRRMMTSVSATVNTTPTENNTRSAKSTVTVTASTTSSKVVSNFFMPASKKSPSKASWETVDTTLLVCRYGKDDPNQDVRPRKIAAFDYDSTLISTQSGKKFSREAADWKWWHASVPGRLASLHEEGYKLVIISNQGGLTATPDPKSKTIKADADKLTKWKSKAKAVLETLDLPITLYAATGYDNYRKPRIGMWRQLVKDAGLTDDGDIDHDGCVFVGDAAGRIQGRDGSKDFSCSDRDLAANIGIPFHTPEEFFLDDPIRTFVRDFEPTEYLKTLPATPVRNPLFIKSNAKDIVLFVGSPGAGKSSFYWHHLQPLGYARVNQDNLKTRDKCIDAAAEFLRDGQSVAVDNTNADHDVRRHWMKLAKEHNVSIRCVLFTAGPKLCEHNNTVRALGGGGEELNREGRELLPKMAFAGFAKRYQAPSVKEGFQDITKVDFHFGGSEEARRVWGMYWIN